ncbi:MAG: glycosyltransferase family 39 protein [Nocardioidaceae bacterium]
MASSSDLRPPTAAAHRLDRADPAWRPLAALAAAVTALLVAVSGGYGYHRDELYFLACGRHLAWGYPDQPPLVPLLARVMSTVWPDSLVALRLPSALATGAVLVLTGLLARELGADAAGQLLAAGCLAVSALLLAVGHLLSTATIDLLVWTALSWLVVRILRGGDERGWLLVGLVCGVGLLANNLVLFLAFGLFIGVLIAGPRRVLASRWLWAGAVLAIAVWAPNLVWQATHGWPQLELGRAIAAGSSGTSKPRLLFLPFQLVLISPVLVPVWGAGLVRLLRDPALVRVRCLGWAYPVLALVFLLTGGKPYYLGGLYPALLAAGAVPMMSWLRRGGSRLRRVLLPALVLSAAVSVVLMLPVVPVADLHATPIVDINYDAGETVGWPLFARTVAAAYESLPAAQRVDAIVLAGNYGEAGAIDHYGPGLGLPPVYSGHNGYGLWGPPPDTGGATIAVGIPRKRLDRLFGTVQLAGSIDNGVGLDNEEQGTPVWICRDQLSSWARSWPQLLRIG